MEKLELTPLRSGWSGLMILTLNSPKRSWPRLPPPAMVLLYSAQSPQLYQRPGWRMTRPLPASTNLVRLSRKAMELKLP